MKAKRPLSRDYVEFVTELKQRIVSARLYAARAVNRDLIQLYWDIGRGIVEKQRDFGWGDAVVETLSEDLRKAFPNMRGFAARSLWNMRRLYSAYSSPEFLQQLVAEMSSQRSRHFLPQPVAESSSGQPKATPLTAKEAPQFLRQLVAEIPWGQHLLILDKVRGASACLYYLRATSKLGWSRNVLLNQIKAKAYERSLGEGKTHNFPTVLPEYLAEQAEEALKSSYNLEFLGIRREVKERELEDRLVERLRDFILELGYGFCFVGRQHRLTLSKKEFFIDLLFYHRFLKALVAVELKVGPFEPEYAGKMDFYLNLLNDKERAPDDNPSIGIILCAEKDDIVVEFSLKTKTNPIGVAEYYLTEKLPKELRGKLPSERQLLAAVKEAIEA
jgi:predicted nuclease of restriction endonuclease-like (RecB) superfamily